MSTADQISLCVSKWQGFVVMICENTAFVLYVLCLHFVDPTLSLRGFWFLNILMIAIDEIKVYITPSSMWGGLYNPLTYETIYITPWTFQNQSNYPPKIVLKNHSKSQKNHKIENPIVLDSKWVDLHSERIIWYALVHFLQL